MSRGARSDNDGKSQRPARDAADSNARDSNAGHDDEPAGACLDSIRKTLDGIESANGRLNACSVVTRDHALGGAEMADKFAAIGAKLGPLHGLPIVVKDIIDVTGLPTRSGSLTRKSIEPAHYDAQVVSRLRAAGAIVVAKTNTVEYAFGGWGTNETVGTPRNPWDMKVHRVPGGSSSGTGVAVGAGLVPAGLGTDTGGSVRQPAALCGCVGLKTSIGLVGRSGVTPLCGMFDTVGPLTDTVRRAAQMLSVMQGEDALDRTTQGIKRADPLEGLDRGAEGLRLGILLSEQMPLMTAEVGKIFKAATGKLEALGAILSPFRLPRSLEDYTRACGAMIAVEAYAHYGALAEDAKSPLNAAVRTRMLSGKTMSGAQLLKAETERLAAIAEFLGHMDRLDAILLPTIPFSAIPVAEVDESQVPLGVHNRFVNYLELCGLAVPMGLCAKGLPLSLQIVARRFDDPLALRIGQAYETARGVFPKPRL